MFMTRKKKKRLELVGTDQEVSKPVQYVCVCVNFIIRKDKKYNWEENKKSSKKANEEKMTILIDSKMQQNCSISLHNSSINLLQTT